MVGKPVEMLSIRHGRDGLTDHLRRADALPLRDAVPLVGDPATAGVDAACCRDQLRHAVPDDEIDCWPLLIVEQHSTDFTTADVGRVRLRHLPGGMTFTAEREAYAVLLGRAGTGFGFGAEPEVDRAQCSDCSGATVSGPWGLTGRQVPQHFVRPWDGRVRTSPAGTGELAVDDLIARTVAVMGPSPSTPEACDTPS